MAKKQEVEQKDSQPEDIDLNLDNMEENDDFMKEAQQKAKEESEEEKQPSGFADLDQDELEEDEGEEGTSEAGGNAESVSVSVDEKQSETEAEESSEDDEREDDEEEITVSKSEWEALKKESQKNLEGWQRALADYNNLQKQAAEDRERLVSDANKNLMRSLVPLLDNFNLALNHLPEDLEDNNWVEGVVYIHKQMIDILEEDGLTILNPKGETFDPELHEAVEASDGGEQEEETEESSEGQPTVKKVIQPGYKFHDRVLKPAKVTVA